MAGMSLGLTAFAKAALGSTELQKISLGSSLIWEAITHQPIVFQGRGTGGSGTSSGTSAAVTLPSSGAVNGELYLVFFVPGSNATCTTTSTGWTKLTQVANGSDASIAVFAGAVGVAGALTVALSASQTYGYCVIRLAGWNGNVSDIQIASTTGTANPFANPSLTSPFGTLQHGWIVANVINNGSSSYSPSAAPSGYSNKQQYTGFNNASAAYSLVNTAELVANGPTQTPANWGNPTFAGATYTSLLVGVPQ